MIYKMLRQGKTEGFEKGEKLPIGSIGAALSVVCVLAGVVAASATNSPLPALAGGAIGVYLMFAIRVAGQWEKVAVLRLAAMSACAAPACSTSFPSWIR